MLVLERLSQPSRRLAAGTLVVKRLSLLEFQKQCDVAQRLAASSAFYTYYGN